MVVIVNNQDKLFDFVYGKQTPPPKASIRQRLHSEDNDSFSEDPSRQTEILETCGEIFKEEPVFAWNVEEIELKTEELSDDEKEVIAVEDSSDENNLVEVAAVEPKKKIARLPPKPKQIEPKSDQFCPYEECQKLFTSKRTLRMHVEAVHQNIKKFRCKFPNCGYDSYQRSNVVNHQISVHKLPNPKTYFCEQCGIQFP